MHLDLSNKSNAPQPGPASHNTVKPTKDWKKSGGNQSPGGGAAAPNPGNIDAPDVRQTWNGPGATTGYIKLSDSPVQDRPEDYPVLPTRRTYGIDLDHDYCGSYTGGTGNKKAT